MKTEADLNQQPEFKIPEGYVSDSQLVVPSLMPFLSEDNLAREVFKRNLRQPEQNKKKVAQKQIEEEFGSSIFIDTAKLLEEWSYIVRDENNQDALICPKELVLPAIFKYFHEVNQLTIESRGQTDGNEIVVPVLGKPRSLIQAFNVYNRN
jgi:hypothetical protein